MVRTAYLLLFLCIASGAFSQSKDISLGIFTGITSTYTWDEGINLDPRYKLRYDVKFAPFGIHYGIDYEGFGFMISPGIITIGQNYHMINTSGGQEGTRKIDVQYLNLPLALKLHVMDMSFFKVSFVLGGGVGYVMSAKETIKHNAAKFTFPSAVYPVLPPEYTVQYDGVLSPAVNQLEIVKKEDFNPIQIFGSAGFCSDWNLTDSWRISFDLRANYGFTDSRTNTYLSRVKANETLYDIYGKRRDIFVQLNIGISKFITIEKEEQERKVRAKGSSKKFKPQKYPWVKNRKPKY